MVQAEQWKLIGNAVSVDVAKWIGDRLAHPLRHRYSEGPQDQPFKVQQPQEGTELEEEALQVRAAF